MLMLVAIPLQLLLLAAAMTGDQSWTLAWSALPDVVTTHSGHTLMMSLCFVPFLLSLSFIPSALRFKTGIWTLAWSALPDVVTTHSGHRLLTLFHDDNLPLPRLAFERIWFLHYLRGPERMAQTRAVLGTLMAELGACTSA